MNKTTLAIVALATAAAGTCLAAGTVDPALQTMADNYDAGFAALKTIVLGILGFGLALGLVKWLRKAK
jgi:hypothetical protein